MKRIALVIAAAIALTLAAAAHGPVRQKVTETVEIAAPPEKVWARIGQYNDMSWFPRVVATETADGHEKDQVRTLTLDTPDGPKIVEELAKYDEAKMMYNYRIDSVDIAVLPVTNFAGGFSVEPGANGGSTVEARAAFYRGFPNNNPPPELNDEASAAAVTAWLRSGLDALKAELEASN